VRGPGRSGRDREFVVLALICLLAFLIRLAYVLTLQPRFFWFDGENYSRLATGLLEHGTYLNDRGHPTAYWPPGYPLFLAAIYRFFGVNIVAVRVVQCLIGAGTVAVTDGIVGAGVMGSDIAYVTAAAGLPVTVCDLETAALEGTRRRIADLAARSIARGNLTAPEADALVGRVSTTDDDAALAGCDLVIEAVSETMDLKRAIFTRLDALLGPGALIASNTSGLSITELAHVTSRPESILGIHFFNPAAVMRLVELIEGDQTAPAAMSMPVCGLRAWPLNTRRRPNELERRPGAGATMPSAVGGASVNVRSTPSRCARSR